MRASRQRSAPNGFTLLEVILASGLTVVLLTAVYQAVAMTYAQLEAGRQVAQDAQLARELARKIRGDLASAYTVYKPPSAAPTGDTGTGTGGGSGDSSGSGTSTGSSSSSSSGSSSNVGMTDYDPPPGGVMGTESALTVVTRVPPTDLDFSSTLTAENGYFPVSDLRIVRYRLGSGASPSDPSSGAAGGLFREEIIRIPDTSSGADPLASARVETLAEEVQSLQFRYYDGVEWLSVWSAEETSAPLAIEIRLSIVPPGLSPQQTQPTPRNYRWMVALPIAAAPAGTSSASGSSGTSSGSSGSSGSTGQSGVGTP